MSAQRIIFASPPPPPRWNAPKRRRRCRPAAARPVAPVLFGLGEDRMGRGERASSLGFLPGPLYAAQLALRSIAAPAASSGSSSSSADDSSSTAGPSTSRSSDKALVFPPRNQPPLRDNQRSLCSLGLQAEGESAASFAPNAKGQPRIWPERRPRPPLSVAWAVDPAHRLPTLWGLYRDLLRIGLPRDYAELGRFVREQFRAKRVETDEAAAANDLRRGYELLDELQTQAGIDRVVGRLHAYYGHQAARYALGTPFRERHTGGRIPGWPDKKGLTTGAVFQASKFNPPLPMMKPQPHNISLMMFRRREACVKATDIVELYRRATEAPLESTLRSILYDADFRTRLVSARRILSAAERRAQLSPEPELVVRLLPAAVRRERWAAAKRARGESVRIFGDKESQALQRRAKEAEAEASEVRRELELLPPPAK